MEARIELVRPGIEPGPHAHVNMGQSGHNILTNRAIARQTRLAAEVHRSTLVERMH